MGKLLLEKQNLQTQFVLESIRPTPDEHLLNAKTWLGNNLLAINSSERCVTIWVAPSEECQRRWSRYMYMYNDKFVDKCQMKRLHLWIQLLNCLRAIVIKAYSNYYISQSYNTARFPELLHSVTQCFWGTFKLKTIFYIFHPQKQYVPVNLTFVKFYHIETFLLPEVWEMYGDYCMVYVTKRYTSLLCLHGKT